MASDFLDRVRLDGERLDANVKGRVRSAKLIRPYEGATSIELRLDDSDFELLRSGVLSKRGKPTGRAKRKPQFDPAAWAKFGETRLVVDGVGFRLAGVSGGFNSDRRFELDLTFEDEVAIKLRRYERRVVATRRDNGRGVTRAGFVARLCQIAKVRFDIPERGDAQPVRGSTPKERAKVKRKGIDKNADLTIKGVDATRAQLDILETALAVADEERAGDRAARALIVALIQESTVTNLTGGDQDSVGPLQLRSFHLNGSTSTNGGRRDVELVCRLFLTRGFWGKGGAIKVAKENPEQSVGWIAQQVQGSGYPDAYDPWADEAQDILDAWGPGGVGPLVIDRKTYEFRNRKGTPFFNTQADLAREVRVRHFATENTLHYVSDDYLIGLEPVFALSPDAPGVLDLHFDADVGMPIAEMTWTVIKPPWTGRAGIPATVKELGPLNGRWLIARAEEDLLEIDPATVVLRRPSPQLREPAPDSDVRQLTEAPPEAGSVRDAMVDAALKAFRNKSAFVYAQVRPMPKNLFKLAPSQGQAPISEQPIFTGYQAQRMDCSGFVTLIYKYAGAPDPNGSGYNGQGYTGTLWANGEKTSDPQPGDLAFYGIGGGGADHVAIYIGKGEVVSFGSPGGPYKVRTRYRSDFSGFRTYAVS